MAVRTVIVVSSASSTCENFAEHSHARPDRGLRHVDGSDTACSDVPSMLPATSSRSRAMNSRRVILGASADLLRTNEHDGRSKSIHALLEVSGKLGSDRPCSVDEIADIDNTLQKRCPTGRGQSFLCHFRLLESVEESWPDIPLSPRHACWDNARLHALHEESLCCFSATMSMWGRDKFLVLWHQKAAKQVWPDVTQRFVAARHRKSRKGRRIRCCRSTEDRSRSSRGRQVTYLLRHHAE